MGGSFPIQKITLQIFLVSKRYILVVNFGKNVQKGGGGHLQSKKFHCKFTHIYEFSRKKRNVISKNRGGGAKAVWTFSKKTSKSENRDTPNMSMCEKVTLFASESNLSALFGPDRVLGTKRRFLVITNIQFTWVSKG